MDSLIAFLQGLVPAGFEMEGFLRGALVVVLGTLILGLIGRLIFGRNSALNRSVSAAIGILLMYVVTVVIYSTGAPLEQFLSPLPFVSINGDYLSIFVFEGALYTDICAQLLGMIILAFLVNLLDTIMPRGKKLLSWYFFRFVTVLLGMLLHLVVNSLLYALLPAGFMTYAPAILLGILVFMLLLGVLKLLLGAVLTIVNPVLGALYTFFFSHKIGRELSRAVLTTAVLAVLVWVLNSLGTVSLYIASSALAAYLPLLILLLIVWYLVGHIL